jgi:hypothetical protein
MFNTYLIIYKSINTPMHANTSLSRFIDLHITNHPFNIIKLNEKNLQLALFKLF